MVMKSYPENPDRRRKLQRQKFRRINGRTPRLWAETKPADRAGNNHLKRTLAFAKFSERLRVSAQLAPPPETAGSGLNVARKLAFR